jgi:ligand-binding SRPBCC domain-containing protein
MAIIVYNVAWRETPVPTIRLTTETPAPIALCFDLARSVDIHLASVAHTRERAVAGVTTGLLVYGDSVTWEGVHFGLRQRLTVSISEYDPPHRFVDERVGGAFHDLRLVHEFSTVEQGTRMVDILTFHSPLGVLGHLADTLVLARYMRALLRRRNRHLKKVAEAKCAQGSAQPHDKVDRR